MVNVLRKSFKRRFGLFGRALRRRFPVFTWRVGATAKIHAVPKLAMNPFAGMIENTDQSAAIPRLSARTPRCNPAASNQQDTRSALDERNGSSHGNRYHVSSTRQ